MNATDKAMPMVRTKTVAAVNTPIPVRAQELGIRVIRQVFARPGRLLATFEDLVDKDRRVQEPWRRLLHAHDQALTVVVSPQQTG
jgi:hypothetical protein